MPKITETKLVPYIKLTGYAALLSCSMYHTLSLILILSTLNNSLRCESNIPPNNSPAASLYDFYLERFSNFIESTNQNSNHQEKVLSTPLIDFPIERRQNVEFNSRQHRSRRDSIKPARVYRYREGYEKDEPETDLFSPVFNLKSMDPLSGPLSGHPDSLDPYQNDAQSADASSYSDLIDSGSGNFENPTALEDSTNHLLEDSIVHNEYDKSFNSIAPTPVQTQTSFSSSPTQNMISNKPPYLNRRLPRLAVTAGQVWRYSIPSDTFMDEDGDLKKLKSAIVRKTDGGTSIKQNTSNLASTSPDSTQYYSWVQYDASSQILYGLPTENDIGRHEIILVVGDSYGATSQEIIEIHVRQHQSSRAFTHQFLINNIFWQPEKFPSMVDTLVELIKQISTRVFLDRAFENFIVQRYSVNDQTSSEDNKRMSFNLVWSNNSVPIHPCSLSQIENLFRSLINTQFMRPDWSSDVAASSKFPPSTMMLRILEPDFRPDSVGINLLGSCDSRELFKNRTSIELDNSESTPTVRVKIGSLSWKLGQPVRYQIPVEAFGSDRGAYTTRDLQLSLHTIDGLTLDKDPYYEFIEFDQESQLIYGLPFSQEDHTGQRELQITARHPKSGYRVKEVIIINIESQDLTTINNRAFQMSLYFHSRVRTFGPRERVSLSQKIVAVTEGSLSDRTESAADKRITIIDIAKNINRGQLQPGMQRGHGGEYVDITKLERRSDLNSIDLKELNAPVYKFTWTNESIGYLGDCPVEVIEENIFDSLEQSMIDFKAPDNGRVMEDQNKSDSTRFFERLRQYFEPELDFIQLRFEPLGACVNAMELRDVGNSDMADMIDQANELDIDSNQELNPLSISQAAIPKIETDAGSEEYWSIVVLLVLVVTLIFVIVMFFMGMHTYKINQDKRFEMQVKLAQARQNSMYLSSMILANLASPNDCGSASIPNGSRNMCIVQDEEKGSRKPVILDNERRLFSGDLLNANEPRSMAVQLDGTAVRTTPVKPNSTVTLDSMASIGWQPTVMGLSMSPSALLYTSIDGKRGTMTLNRRASIQRQMQLPLGSLNHSQSILTVASLAGPLPVIPQGGIPLMYATALPVMNGPSPAYNYASLQRVHQNTRQGELLPARVIDPNYQMSEEHRANQISPAHQQNNLKSSRSSSMSATTNSVISNPNYSPHR